jgi:flagellar basal-body rod protein FlgB
LSKVVFGDDRAATALKRILDRHAARQRVAASNLANVDTEGYTPSRVEFKEEFGRALGGLELQRTDPGHLSTRPAGRRDGYRVVEDPGRDLDLEAAMAELADAQMAYATAARLMSKRVTAVKTAIRGNP